jgi:alkylation response protein AidB-like acyl-CoA dehydrogenase
VGSSRRSRRSSLPTRDDVAAWLAASWDPERPLREWRELLADSGWGCPTWPREWFGRGLSQRDEAIVREEFARIGAVGTAGGSAMSLAAPTMVEHGDDDVKSRLLRPAITGEHTWCQLFSEPGSGSDLAGLSARAVRDGDEWVISGQKVWNTGAVKADYGMLLARTDWDVPKHRGITWFALPMKQDGVEVRPLKQMNEYASFNEVFLTEARVPHANVVGGVNNGWAVATTTLMFERTMQAARLAFVPDDAEGRCAAEAKAEASAYAQTYVWYPQRAGRADLVLASHSSDAVTRQRIIDVYMRERTMRWTAMRAAEARRQGKPPGPEGSLAKLAASELARRCAVAHTHLRGAHAMLAGDVVHEILVSVPAVSIAGGTDEIQHNIIGERVLGLPKEPSVDTDVPFRDVRRN